MVKTALIVNGSSGAQIFRALNKSDQAHLVGLACLDGQVDWLLETEKKSCLITSDLDKIIALPELEAVIDATGEEEVARYLKAQLNKKITLEKISPHHVLWSLVGSNEQLLETRLLKGELKTILSAVQDAIEVVNEKGIVKYVNPAFTRVTGIAEKKRLGQNIFDVSPHGALAESLIQQKPVTGYRTYVGGSKADVVSNASPIIVDGELMGAVVVFQPVSDILKLMDELKHSNAVIDNLYAQIDQISGSRFTFESLSGQSSIFKATVDKAKKAARTETTILLSGENGTGKALFAQAIHNHSKRRKRPLIVFDCAAVPDSLQEIELFGCEKGALPGVHRTRIGKVELAEKSTLFIKEVGLLNLHVQKKLLTLLQERTFNRIGGDEKIETKVHMITSAATDLLTLSLKGHFLEELYHLFSRGTIDLPALRNRTEDLPLLASALLERLNRKLDKKITEISVRAMQEMSEYAWPGNISELKSVLERSMMVAEGSVIKYHHLIPYIGRLPVKEGPVIDQIIPLDKMEEMMLKLALTRYGETLEGKKKAAQVLNISLATLYNKLKKYSS